MQDVLSEVSDIYLVDFLCINLPGFAESIDRYIDQKSTDKMV